MFVLHKEVIYDLSGFKKMFREKDTIVLQYEASTDILRFESKDNAQKALEKIFNNLDKSGISIKEVESYYFDDGITPYPGMTESILFGKLG